MGVSAYLSKKIFAAITFLRVLEASWSYELLRCGSQDEQLKKLAPDFNEIFDSVRYSIEGLISKGFSGTIRSGDRSITIKDVRSFVEQSRSNKKFEDFFTAVWKSRCKVQRAQ
jgi:hypothetical protein